MATRTNKPGNATLDAVAAAAGVSTMTVSRVLRNKSHVSAETREKVMSAVDALGYVPNRLAGALASSQSAHVAVIIPTLRNIVYPEVLAGIADALEGSDLQPLIGLTEYDLERERDVVRGMLAWRPAGVVIAGSHHHPETQRMLRATDIPVVQVMELTDDPIDMCVGIDHAAAGAAMAMHLLEKGYRTFGYLGADHALDRAAERRFDSFRATVLNAGGTVSGVKTVPTPSGIGIGRYDLPKLLAEAPSFQALYVSNDAVAAGAMMHCMHAGLSVPGDLAIASFSGLEIAAAMPIPITTISSPRYEMGQISIHRIRDRINGRTCPVATDLETALIPGESC